MDYGNIIYNAICTPDGTVLRSRDRHDYRTHMDANGHEYMVDGGTDYLRRNIVKDHPYQELSLTLDDPHKTLREVYTWGSYGVDGDQPLKVKPLKDLDKDHIDAIIRTQKQLPEHIIQLFKNELDYREDDGR